MRYCVGGDAETYLAAAEEVGLLHVIGIHAGGDADHPEELVDVVAAVADEAADILFRGDIPVVFAVFESTAHLKRGTIREIRRADEAA